MNFFFQKIATENSFSFSEFQIPLDRFASVSHARIVCVCASVWCIFFNNISECIDNLLWVFSVFCSWLFWLCYEQISVAFFLLILILHFSSHVHILITQLLVDAFACSYAFGFIYVFGCLPYFLQSLVALLHCFF